MASRPIESKRERASARSLRVSPTSYVDVFQWLKLRHNLTTGTCKTLLRGGALKVDSHTITERYIPAEQAKRLLIVDPETGGPVTT